MLAALTISCVPHTILFARAQHSEMVHDPDVVGLLIQSKAGCCTARIPVSMLSRFMQEDDSYESDYDT